MRIDHVQLAAPSGGEPKAREFFVGLLRMVEEDQPEELQARGGCWFRRGSCFLHIGIDPAFVPQRKAHPAFLVPDGRNLADCLQAAGYEVIWDDTIPGVSRFYSAVPFGNRLEFILDG